MRYKLARKPVEFHDLGAKHSRRMPRGNARDATNSGFSRMDDTSRQELLNSPSDSGQKEKIMKNSMLLVILFAFAGVGHAAHATAPPARTAQSKSSTNFTITAELATEPIHLGQPIIVNVTVKNVSAHDVYWRSEASETAYRAFHVLLTRDGKEVEKTRLHRIVRNEQRPSDPNEMTAGSSIVTAIAPGMAFTLTIDLNRLYEITKPGEYTLEISRVAEDHKTVIHSNKLKLTIFP